VTKTSLHLSIFFAAITTITFNRNMLGWQLQITSDVFTLMAKREDNDKNRRSLFNAFSYNVSASKQHHIL
jgi:hypothetical protein